MHEIIKASLNMYNLLQFLVKIKCKGEPILPLIPLELDRIGCFADSAEIDDLPSQCIRHHRIKILPTISTTDSPLKE